VSLTELRTQLEKLGLSPSTPGLHGAARRDALAQRLHEARGDVPLPVARNMSNKSSEREAALLRRTMNELRGMCEETGLSTATDGLSGDARHLGLARRIARGRHSEEHEALRN
jgi:hypothetical protein